MKNQQVKVIMRIVGAASLVIFPLALMLAFALHYDNLADFFVFEFRYEPSPAREFMNTLISSSRSRLYTIPHGIAYLSIPLLIATALWLGSILFREKPYFALIGTSMACIGAIYLGGLFGAWLSFAAIGNVTAEQVEGAIPALEALTEMQGPLLLTTILSSLGLLGLMVLAVGLFISAIVPKWSALMIFIGNLIIFIFMDLDNWMFIGAFIMLLGMARISLESFKRDEHGGVYTLAQVGLN